MSKCDRCRAMGPCGPPFRPVRAERTVEEVERRLGYSDGLGVPAVVCLDVIQGQKPANYLVLGIRAAKPGVTAGQKAGAQRRRRRGDAARRGFFARPEEAVVRERAAAGRAIMTSVDLTIASA